jgi:methionyl aminopeptidase
MIIIKTAKEIDGMRASGAIMKEIFLFLKKAIKPGVSTKQIETWCVEIMTKYGAIPTFKGYNGFPGAVCVSVNDTILHGIPSDSIICVEGDIVSVDVGVTLNGYITDACRTFEVGKVSDIAHKLVVTTKECFFKGVSVVKPDATIGDIGAMIAKHGHLAGFTLTRDFVGHGVGTLLHEDPAIPNVGIAKSGPKLKEGMTIAIEPMLNEGKVALYIDPFDHWTVRTVDARLSAHYENTLVVTSNGYELLTQEDEEVR